MRAGDRVFWVYLALVSLSGAAVLIALLSGAGIDEVTERPVVFLVLGLCTVLGEIRPVNVLPRRHAGGVAAVTTSISFAFALLLMGGPATAALALVVASVVADTINRKGLVKTIYNAGQYAVTIAAVGIVIAALSGSHVLIHDGRISGRDVIPLAAATVVFYLVNNTLVGTVVGLSQGAPLVPTILGELVDQAPPDGLLLGMAPIVVAVADRNLGLIPFLLLPVAAVYMSTRASLEKEHQALHDSLTGLPNRTLFRDAVDESLTRSPDGTRSAVMLIDLDRFKEVNDTLGHHIGDLLLKEVGPRLRESLRDQDLIARLGGDEFAIFIEDVGETDLPAAVAQRALAGLGDPFTVEDLALHLDGSIGIALSPDHGVDVDTLLQRADVAMYAAKEEHAGFMLYSPERDPYSRRRLTLLSELRGAIERGELILHYQPKADLRTRRITDVEALVRWNHPTLGMVPPNDFVPLAERSGLIGPLTEYVLREALRQAAGWWRDGNRLRVSVNLSVHNLMDADLPILVKEVLTSEGLPASALELEITETTVMSDPVRALRVLQPLSDMGVRLSMDDFGTGYSSLAYLQQLPISEIKIDRSFVAHVETNANDAIIVRSTIELARNLGLEIVAEGVETAEALEFLDRLGCDYVQGYYLSRPVPEQELRNRLLELDHFWHGSPPSVGVRS